MTHPYRQTLEESLSEHKTLLGYYNEVISFLTPEKDFGTGTIVLPIRTLADVQNDITLLETKTKIKTLEKVIAEKQKYFDIFIEQLAHDEKEMNENFDKYLEKAKVIAKSNDVVNRVIGNMRFEVAEGNLQVKIELYKELKKIISHNMKAV